jgi:hypothetical protein
MGKKKAASLLCERTGSWEAGSPSAAKLAVAAVAAVPPLRDRMRLNFGLDRKLLRTAEEALGRGYLVGEGPDDRGAGASTPSRVAATLGSCSYRSGSCGPVAALNLWEFARQGRGTRRWPPFVAMCEF